EIDRARLEGARRRGAQEFTGGIFERFQRDIHRLELRFAGAHHRSEGNKAEMLVQLKLARGPGNNREVVAFFNAMLPEQSEDSLQYLGAAEFFLDGQQANFANRASGGTVRVEILQLLIERKWARATHGEHSDELLSRETDEIGIFRVKFVDETMGGRSVMLRNFLNECFVVEPVNLLELPIFVGGFKGQRLPCAHNDLSLSASIWRRSRRLEISSAIFLRCANRTKPFVIVSSTTCMRSCPRKSATSGRETMAKRPGKTVRHCKTNAPKKSTQ